MKRNIIIILTGLIIVIGVIIILADRYYDIFHKTEETVDKLIGQNFDYARKVYFKSDPDISNSFNINKPLNEFEGCVLSKKSIIRDSIIKEFTWIYYNHKTTIWVTKTDRQQLEIIDALRYSNGVKF